MNGRKARARRRGAAAMIAAGFADIVRPGPQPPKKGIGRTERRKARWAARRVFKRLGTCPHSKLRDVPEALRDLWIAQRAIPAMPQHEAERSVAVLSWLLGIPEIHALAASE